MIVAERDHDHRPVHPDLAGAVAPRASTESWLAAIWADALDVRAVGVTDDFARLSGDDEAAARIAAQVVDYLRGAAAFDPAMVFSLRTVAAMADFVRDALDPQRIDPLTVLRAPGPAAAGQAPLFLFAPGGGSTSLYAPLVDRLDTDVPVYGLEPLAGLAHSASRAARYRQVIGELVPARPRGPGRYRLGGCGSGGTMAREVARHLVARGEQVDLVFVVEPALVGLPAEPERLDAVAAGRHSVSGYDERVVLYTSRLGGDAPVVDAAALCLDLEVVTVAGGAWPTGDTSPAGEASDVASHLNHLLRQ